MKKIKVLFLTTVMTLLVTNAYAAKDCSAFTHALDIKICEARNTQGTNDINTSTTESSVKGKVSGFFGNIANTLKLKKHKKYREVGDN